MLEDFTIVLNLYYNPALGAGGRKYRLETERNCHKYVAVAFVRQYVIYLLMDALVEPAFPVVRISLDLVHDHRNSDVLEGSSTFLR